MNLTLALCRAQENLHLRRASDTELENVRRVATEAAAAWAKEAQAAERREERQTSVGARDKAGRDTSSGSKPADEMFASENPDLGHASMAIRS